MKKTVHVMRRAFPDKWGGTESVVFNVARELARQGVESVVFCTAMFSAPGDEVLDGIPVKRFRYVFPWFGLSAEAKGQLRLKGGSPLSLPLFFGLLREKNLSLIHVHVQHRLGGMVRTAARLKGIPYVVSIHGGCFTVPAEQNRQMMAPFKGKLEWGRAFGLLLGARRVLKDADAIICVGENERAEVQRRFPGKSVLYVPNGVDIPRFAGADATLFREAFGFQSTEKIVLCVARIDYQKNQLGLVRAFARFAQHHPDHRLVLIGPVTVEAYRDEVVAEVERLDLAGRVKLIEGLSPGDPLLPSAYAAAEQFVLPSHHEPFGIAVLEAWAAGIPVTACRVGGIPGFAEHEENILLAEPGDEPVLADCMGRLADDEALRGRLSANAFTEVSAKYSWSVAADSIRSVYESVMRNK
ncbi:glycosyltransferase family 4 protein [Pontiella sulfatireligans]|uniref:glycosyltransferase family 4 protein n=1 Tax=Pontiella sulfatireligans TaxID=2750658 RepID=UPI0014442AD9|nr:glycosyltransferase family 4 protein [Pontiella sulfatireligans]